MNTQIDWSLVMSITAIVISVLSPLITALINVLYDNRKRNFEFSILRKTEIIENYISAVGTAISTENAYLPEYGEYKGKVIMYLPNTEINGERPIELVSSIDKYLKNFNYEIANRYLLILCETLREYHPWLKKHDSRKKH